MEKYKDLSDQIWTTRISRVNAEKRLINKEAFFQGINIYYSCVTIIFSILTLLNKNEKLKQDIEKQKIEFETFFDTRFNQWKTK